ncbi:P-selectin-like [Branchiostoma floridae x Branchiostoma belcheri]
MNSGETAGCAATPPSPPNTHRTDCTAPYSDGEKCKYVCIAGYSEVSGDKKLVCRGGVWVGDPLVCKENCDPPMDPDNTERKGCGDPYKHGEVCKYKCKGGYARAEGDHILTCDNGAWVGNPLVCEKNCGKPPSPPGTKREDCTYPIEHDEVCTYECKDGYTEVGGDDRLTCDSGVWFGAPLVCKENCKKPPNPAGTVRTGCDAPYTHGEVCDYLCEFGYIKTGGDDSLTCNDGDWIGEKLACIKPGCAVSPPSPPNTLRTDCTAPYRDGEKCRYECADGYTEVSGDSKLICKDQVWVGDPLVCQKNCDPHVSPDNTERKGCSDPYKHGEVCTYTCQKGFDDAGGDPQLTCDNGVWLGVPLVCKENCDNPPMPPCSKRKDCSNPYGHDEVCTYECKDGYTKVGGDDTLTCHDGVWSGNPLVCKGL